MCFIGKQRKLKIFVFFIVLLKSINFCSKHRIILTTEREMEGARAGKIQWKWDDETEEAISGALQLFYLHLKIKEIPAVKIFGRD